MSATTTLDRALEGTGDAPSSWWRRATRGVSVTSSSAPPLSPRLQLVRASLTLVFVLGLAFLLQLTVVSRFQHRAAQGTAFASFREELAIGTAPIGPTDSANKVLELGRPVAFLQIPALGLEEVVGEGTTAEVLFDGPGHRRDTPLPGQLGTSVVFARRASFGGPFHDAARLPVGANITVTTGQGTFQYKVIGVRYEGQPAPPPVAKGAARLTLVTASGRPFLPDGVARVDADLVGTPVVGAARLVSGEAALPAEERAMGIDARTLWALALWLQALIALTVGSVWAWHRWGRAQAWVVFLPMLMLVGLAVSGEVARLLPNLL